jgi:hypothetical protein
VFADAFGPAIRKITPRGTIETIHEGPRLMQPKDVSVDLDGSYLVADFDTFKDGARTAIFRITQDGKVSVISTDGSWRRPSGTFFVTTVECRPTLQKQQDDAERRGQVGRQKIFDGPLTRLDRQSAGEPREIRQPRPVGDEGAA